MSYLKCQSENIYYIGGSPCSGKSTVAARLAEKYGFYGSATSASICGMQ